MDQWHDCPHMHVLPVRAVRSSSNSPNLDADRPRRYAVNTGSAFQDDIVPRRDKGKSQC
jgi:hypothetical protein